jgi:hypothetical protein
MMVDPRKAWSVRLRAFSRIVHVKASLSRPAKMSESFADNHAAPQSNQEEEILDGMTNIHPFNRTLLTIL